MMFIISCSTGIPMFPLSWLPSPPGPSLFYQGSGLCADTCSLIPQWSLHPRGSGVFRFLDGYWILTLESALECSEEAENHVRPVLVLLRLTADCTYCCEICWAKNRSITFRRKTHNMNVAWPKSKATAQGILAESRPLKTADYIVPQKQHICKKTLKLNDQPGKRHFNVARVSKTLTGL